MRLRQGLNRPPPLVKPYHGEDDNNFSSFDRPSPGKRHLPLRTRRRHDSFRSRLEYDDFTAQKSGIWKGESLEQYNDTERWRGESHEKRRNRHEGGRASLFDSVELQSSPNQDWCEMRNDTHRTDSSYLGGYDFRDDVESIDTWEGKQRRQRRLAEALQEGNSFSRRSPLSSEYHPITVECPHDFSLGGFHRAKSDFFGRDGNTVTSTIATDDEDSISQLQSVSTKSNDSGLNPQLLHAKSVPELPPGYLQRHDGVVISLGSSVVSTTSQKERYADVDERAETAAQSVVDQLRALGYRVDDTNGILGSNSDSGIFSKYGGKHSWTPSVEVTSVRSQASTTNSKRSQDKTRTQDAANYGMQYPPALSTRSSGSMGRGFTHPIKAKASSNELQSHGSRKSNGNTTTAIDNESHGSRRLNTNQLPDTQGMPNRNQNFRVPIDDKQIIIQKLNNNTSNDARSTGSKKSDTRRLVPRGSNRSNSSKNGERQSKTAYPPASSASEVRNLTLDGSELEENTCTRASTVMADGSTLTSRPDDPAWNSQRRSMVFDLAATQFATLSHTSSYNNTSAIASKHVNFLGEYPEINGAGGRVPELVTRLDGLTSAMSDLSHQRSAGGSTLSSLTFNNNNQISQLQPPLTTFCEKVLYSCRISAFPSTRGG